METRRQMEALLTGCYKASTGGDDVIDFAQRLRDDCKVSYISGARVTEADADDWMALPLLGERETEATRARHHFLLLHVPSLREFLHKLDALPPTPPPTTTPAAAIVEDQRSPTEDQGLAAGDQGPIIEDQRSAIESTIEDQRSIIEDQRSIIESTIEDQRSIIEDQRSIIESTTGDQGPPIEDQRSIIELEAINEELVEEEQAGLEIKLEEPDVDTASVLEMSVITTVSSIAYEETDGEEDVTIQDEPSSVIQHDVSALADNVIVEKEEEEHLKQAPPPSSSMPPREEEKIVPPAMKRLRSASPVSSSYYEPDDVTTSEELSVIANDTSPLVDYLQSFGDDSAPPSPDTTQPSSPPLPFSSSLMPAVCTFKIEPAPAVDCGWPIDRAALIMNNDPETTLRALIAKATANAAAAAAAPPTPPVTVAAPVVSSTASDADVADLPPARKALAVAVKKQMITQSPCPRCYKMIERLDEMRTHIEEGSCTMIGAHACDVCGKRLASKWTLKKHLERHAEKPRCTFCSNMFDSLEELRDHNLVSGHMFRPEEAGAAAPEISQLRKQRRKEQKEAARKQESVANLSSVMDALSRAAPIIPSPASSCSASSTAPTTATTAAASETPQLLMKPPAAKKRKTAQPVDEAAAAVAFLMAEQERPIGEED